MKINGLYCVILVSVNIQIVRTRDTPWPRPPNVTPQPIFDPTKYHDFRKPEPKRKEKLRPGLTDFGQKYPGVTYMPKFFAGKAEFPWIVHIRDIYNLQFQDWYSVGNLISTQHVLTTCRAVTRLNCTIPTSKDCIGEPDCPCPNSNNDTDRLVIAPYQLMIYYFSQSDRDEDMTRMGGEYIDVNDDMIHGTRVVDKVIVSLDCLWHKYLFNDQAVLTMKHPIAAYSLYLNIIRVHVLANTEFNRLQYIEERRVLCYVATYGNMYNGVPFRLPKTYGYKVKYRAYPVEWSICKDLAEYLCRGDACKRYTKYYVHFENPEQDKIECWETRNKIGAVCDHDRGAPLVCDGITEGLVIRGVFKHYCNAGIPMPFIIQRISFSHSSFLYGLTRLNLTVPLRKSPIPFPVERDEANLGFNVPVTD